MNARLLLIGAASLSVLVALLHVYVIVQGAWAYRYFGAGEKIATMAEQGSWFPALLTAGVTLVFMIFAAYYLSGASVVPALPFLRLAMAAIAAIYTLRGIMVVAAVFMHLTPFEIGSSLASLAIGLVHCAALALTWSYLPAR
ncbi:hypothetical protein [Janthinobacterium fluminis]|uniref:DUF3995 domain-containing protein n=1 Tax=Janthinobacterium fluminis TaxID=2987524 RepID=A0ABT5K251_9BURK|nr:hypothetical protein [Janthinobacterium fluminis]MDC8758954.1 hypothetical protein [Janthinobacterium fluminis]